MYCMGNNMIDHKNLLERVFLVTEFTSDDVEDIVLCGSYVWGNPTEESDIDVAIYMKPNKRIMLFGFMFNGKYVHVKTYPSEKKYNPYMNKYNLPLISLINGKKYFFENNDIEVFKQERGKRR